jgi:hypothetical protein
MILEYLVQIDAGVFALAQTRLRHGTHKPGGVVARILFQNSVCQPQRLGVFSLLQRQLR